MSGKNLIMSDSASKRIGENLLKGWTLLGDNCPDGCNIPLMRSRDKFHLICCECGKDFLETKKATSSSSPDGILPDPSLGDECDSKIAPNNFALKKSVESKIKWISNLIDSTSSVSDLGEILAVAKQLIDLRDAL